jgi:hypothetical protein
MEQQPPSRRKPDPEKMQALRSLPIEIKQNLTREEADAFLYDETWPDSLLEKLKDYLVNGEKNDGGPVPSNED